MSGPSAHLKNGWDLIKKDIDTDALAPVSLYLGCNREIRDVLLDNGVPARKIAGMVGESSNTIVESTRAFDVRPRERG